MPTKPKEKIDVEKSPFEGCVGLVYARVSSKKQETEGHGRESQVGRCKKDLLSIKVPFEEEFLDTFTGGGDFMKRPAMKELLGYIDAHPHKKFVVIFDDLKRFARDTKFHFELRTAFRAREVVLRCLNYNFDESPEGVFVETVLAAGNELERLQNKRQVIQKMKARLEAGYWTFSSKKGYDLEDDLLERNKIAVPNAQGAIIAEAIELFARRVLVRKIDVCRFLVEKEIWKGQAPEKYMDRVTTILLDPFNAGFIEYPKWDISRRLGKHTPLISLETFETVQKILRRENVNKRIRQDISEDFSLRSLITCDHCEKHLTAAWAKGRDKKYAYYVCHTKTCEYYGKSVSADLIEKKFKQVLLKNKLKPKVGSLVDVVFERAWKEEVLNFKMQESITASHKKSLEAKAGELANAAIAAKSDAVRRVYERKLEELAIEIEKMEVEPLEELDFNMPYRTALEKATGMLKSPYSVWKILDAHEKQRLFYFIFETKLPYNYLTGYRTDKIPQAIRLFEEFVEQNPYDVLPVGIEPTSAPPQGAVLSIERRERVRKYATE